MDVDSSPGDRGPASPAAVVIRPATTADAAGILAVVGDAFSYGGTRDAGGELAIVRATWSAQAGRPLLELVAVEGGTVVGHLQAAPGRLDGRAAAVAGVAPVCVASAHQGRGTGSTLMAALIGAAEQLHWPLLVLLGDPAYYSRFGFEAAAPLGLNYPPAGAGNRHFQAPAAPSVQQAALRGSLATAGSEEQSQDSSKNCKQSCLQFFELTPWTHPFGLTPLNSPL